MLRSYLTRANLGATAMLGFIATVVLANWAISTFENVPVWPGLVAPAGVYFAGLAFSLRDILHDTLGRRAVFLAISAGALLSWFLSDGDKIPGGVVSIAAASGLAFLFSETVDMIGYDWLRERNWYAAVAVSNVLGFVVDSALFLWLAFGSLEFLMGQIVGKAWMTALAVAVMALTYRRVRERVIAA